MAKLPSSFLCLIVFAAGALGRRTNIAQHAISLADVHDKPDAAVQEDADATKPSTKTRFWAWLGNDNIQIDAVEAEKKLRASGDVLLPAEEEQVIMAFKVGKDKTFFTSTRILFRPKGWLFSSATGYKSVPYSSIVAFEAKTAGGWPDMDTDLILRTRMRTLSKLKIGFRKGTRSEKVNIFDVIKFINAKILGPESGSSLLEAEANPGKERTAADLLHFLGSNAEQIDASASEQLFKETFPILQRDETVEMAFKVGRDSTLLTSKRMLRIDVQGISGRRIKFQSIPWNCVQAYAVQTAGRFDADAEMMIWTNIPSLRTISQDLRKGRADIIGIQRLFSERILGTGAEPPVLPPQQAAPIGQKQVDGAKEILHWLGGDLSSFNPAEAEARLRAVVPILQEDEHVELAYGKRRGRGDMAYLTTKRILYVDHKRNMFFQKDKVAYISIPYASVKAFAVRSAGSFDLDCEFTVWTTIQHEMTPGGENEPPRPIPGVTMLEFDVRKGTDIFLIQRFLYAKVLGGVSSASSLLQEEAKTQAPNLNDVFHWLGNNAAEISPEEATSKLAGSVPVLQPGETVLKAFKTYRDMNLLTTTRVLIVDIQGLSGKKVEYKTVPYTSIGAFGVQSAGALDADSEFKLYTVMTWPTVAVVHQDLRKGTSNLAEIQALFCNQILGSQLPDKESLQPIAPAQGAELAAKKGNVLDWLGGNARKIPAADAEARLSTNPPILQRAEKVKLAYKVGKDTVMFTSDRILVVDVADLEFFRKNPKVEYRTVPYSQVLGFSVKTASNVFDRDEEISAYTQMPALPWFKQDIAKGGNDIFDVQKLLSEKILA